MTKHTKGVYTSNKKPDGFDPGKELVPVVFQGGSIDALRGFPADVKGDLGYALERLQRGQVPPDRKPVRTVGRGVYELREQDARAWYRLLYARLGSTIHVLHCFEKRSNSIEQKDIETAKERLKRILEAERKEKRDVKKALRRR